MENCPVVEIVYSACWRKFSWSILFPHCCCWLKHIFSMLANPVWVQLSSIPKFNGIFRWKCLLHGLTQRFAPAEAYAARPEVLQWQMGKNCIHPQSNYGRKCQRISWNRFGPKKHQPFPGVPSHRTCQRLRTFHGSDWQSPSSTDLQSSHPKLFIAPGMSAGDFLGPKAGPQGLALDGHSSMSISYYIWKCVLCKNKLKLWLPGISVVMKERNSLANGGIAEGLSRWTRRKVFRDCATPCLRASAAGACSTHCNSHDRRNRRSYRRGSQ